MKRNIKTAKQYIIIIVIIQLISNDKNIIIIIQIRVITGMMA
jgi:hypothetical protein